VASGPGIDWANRTLDALQGDGYRNGLARRAVVELLGRQDCCLTAQEIFDALRADGRKVGIASVYRVLELLTEKGLLQRVDFGAAVARFEPAHSSGEHHHHLVCSSCGRVEAFEDDELEAVLHKVGHRTGYSIAGHDVVLRGACGRCAAR